MLQQSLSKKKKTKNTNGVYFCFVFVALALLNMHLWRFVCTVEGFEYMQQSTLIKQQSMYVSYSASNQCVSFLLQHKCTEYNLLVCFFWFQHYATLICKCFCGLFMLFVFIFCDKIFIPVIFFNELKTESRNSIRSDIVLKMERFVCVCVCIVTGPEIDNCSKLWESTVLSCIPFMSEWIFRIFSRVIRKLLSTSVDTCVYAHMPIASASITSDFKMMVNRTLKSLITTGQH